MSYSLKLLNCFSGTFLCIFLKKKPCDNIVESHTIDQISRKRKVTCKYQNLFSGEAPIC